MHLARTAPKLSVLAAAFVAAFSASCARDAEESAAPAAQQPMAQEPAPVPVWPMRLQLRPALPWSESSVFSAEVLPVEKFVLVP